MSDGGEERREQIAIVGMAGRFPRAESVEALWKNLCAGVEAITYYSDDELLANGVQQAELANPAYVKAGAPLENADRFDASFFGYTPREAELMDPQHRVFLECAWAALEDAALDPERYDGLIGLFGGVARNTYFLNTLATRPEMQRSLGHYATMISSDKEFSTARIAYKLNLRGPSVNVQTACSTSGVGFHLACQSLLNAECDVALAGGARILVPPRVGYLYEEDGIPSPDGHCRAFDADAQGTLIGSGVAILVLKLLSDALRDADSIYAVVRGTAINNDGSAKVGFTAPSVDGQARVIEEALAIAEVSAETIGYVETHGTGTQLGDPIEISALTRAFRQSTEKSGYCAIGSVKTNIGHLDAGAAAAGIIKAALALKHEKIPGSLNFNAPNPQIDFESSPFFVNTKLRDWSRTDTPRRAGVSSFGLGGTNFHCVLEEAPKVVESDPARPYELLLLSAKTEESLDHASENLAAFLENHPDVNLGDAAYTLQLGRRAFAHRRMLVCESSADAAKTLREGDRRKIITAANPIEDRSTVFMFPGGGAQYLGMGSGLYETEPVYRGHVDACTEILRDKYEIDLGPLLHEADRSEERAATQLERPTLALTALFTTEYALAQLWRSWGLQPDALIGHSAGEYAAACVAGVLSMEDALAIVHQRGHLFETLDSGSMLGVALSEQETKKFIDDGVAIAAINLPSSCVLSGPVESIDALERRLEDQEIEFSRVRIAVAAHSPMVDPILDDFGTFLRSEISFRPPKIPFVSNVTGTWVTPDEATDPDYWVQHLRNAVRFSDGLATLLQKDDCILLEAGPGQTLATLARQHPAKAASHVVVTSLRHPKESTPDVSFVLNTVGRMWLAGREVDWERFHNPMRRYRVGLPSYSFEGDRHWLELGEPTQPAPLHLPVAEVPRATDELPSPGPFTLAVPASEPIDRESLVLGKLKASLHDLSGIPQGELDEHATFLELGFDSLFLTRANAAFTREFKVKITFRQLFEDAPTLMSLAGYIDERLPVDAYADELAARGPEANQSGRAVESVLQAVAPIGENAFENMLAAVKQQLEAATRQLAALEQMGPTAAGAVAGVDSHRPTVTTAKSPPETPSPRGMGPWKPIAKSGGSDLTPAQESHLAALTERLTSRTKESKRLTADHRLHFADPRAVAGFRRTWKELVYPIVANRSAGSRIWDVDGNVYIDITMGFGVNLFGHSPAFIMDAVREQMEQGVEIGPQSPRAGEIARRICALTGMDRAAFCNTGSEAVLAALRVARTVTGRDRIAMFAGDYHGLFDEVLATNVVTGGRSRTVPAAPGIPPWMVEGVSILEYDSLASLEFIREHAADLAAILVEPVQSRHPDLQPREFLKALRELTEEVGVALIFDEMITGFRSHPGGAQALFGVQADIATYGKVIGGGFPTGIVAGKRLYMDALDGGDWSYGDDSFPEAGVTWFAGTFVRHPVALAAIEATLQELEEKGPALQDELNAKTKAMVDELNGHFVEVGAPISIECFSSLYLVKFSSHEEFSSLFYLHLRDKGIHVTEGRAAFMSTAHSDDDIAMIMRAFKESARELQEGGFLPSRTRGAALDAAGSGETASSIDAATRSEAGEILAPLTDGQLEIWLGAFMGDDANCAFNLSNSIDLEGSLDLDAFERAIQKIIDRHDALRATISENGEHMRIAPSLSIEIPLVDLSGGEMASVEERISELQKEEVETPFDLVHGPLFRTRVLKLSDTRHVVLLTAHHIICDGWSTGVLMRELGADYSAACGVAPENVDEPVHFSEYAERQVELLRGEEFTRDKAFWLDRLSGQLPVLDLPTDRPRPPQRSYAAFREDLELDPDTVKAFKRLGTKHGCTPFMSLLAAYEAFLFRITGQSDLIVGMIAAGQPVAGTPDLVGHCVNLLPIRSEIDGAMPFSEFLTSMRGIVLDAFEHQSCGYGRLLDNIVLPRDLSRVPLVATTFNVDPTMQGVSFHGLNVRVMSNPRSFETFDLFFNIVDRQTSLTIECTFNRNLFDRTTIRRRLDEFQALIAGIVVDASRPINALPILPEEEEQRLLVEWNQTNESFREDLCVHQLFEEQADRIGSAVAAVFPRADSSLTYAELEQHSNRLARYLRSNGVREGDHVALCIERSQDMLIGLLAVLKAGAAYVPLDPTSPPKRMETMLEDSGATALLTQESMLEVLPRSGESFVCAVDRDREGIAGESAERLELAIDPDAIAYTIYTSGSTGKPKGVQVCHRSVVNLLTTVSRNPGFSADDVLLAVSTLSFDIAGIDIYLPLFCGGRVVVASAEEMHDGQALIDILERYEVTFMQATPMTWRLMIASGWEGRSGLLAICTGEPLSRELATQMLERSRELWNLYGPTETTVWVLAKKIEDRDGPILVGRPIGNTQIYILDENQRPVPLGATGEMYIGGRGVAKGYLNRPDLTRKMFVPNPFDASERSRLYRTGDLARYRSNGDLECLGRIDHQIKLRGFRIELGEIETFLESHERIQQSAVALIDAGDADARLVAYCTSADSELPRTELREYLRQYLPEYMVPTLFVQIDRFPLTTSGKVDRKQLPKPDFARSVDEVFVAPRTTTERSLADIWSELLRFDRVGLHDNFFELGGHSLTATKMVFRVRSTFSVELPLREVFESPTVEKLADYIDTILWVSQNATEGAASSDDEEILDI
jgi:amino acid adenylation domain-containing protein